MLNQSLINQRIEELTQRELTDYETEELLRQLHEAWDKLRELIPDKCHEEFSKLQDILGLTDDKVSINREREAYKQGLADGFEIYSIVFPTK